MSLVTVGVVTCESPAVSLQMLLTRFMRTSTPMANEYPSTGGDGSILSTIDILEECGGDKWDVGGGVRG